MSPRIKTLLLALLAFFILLPVFLYYSLTGAQTAEAGLFELDLEKAGRLARQGGSTLPVTVHSELIAEGEFPATFIVAGESPFTMHNLVFTSFQVVWPDNTSVIIDTAHSQKLHREMYGTAPWYEPAWTTMQAAMKNADGVYITHEHPDHIGGIAAAGSLAALAAKVNLTTEQHGSHWLEDVRFPLKALKLIKPFDYSGYKKVRPGLVLIKSPGHSEGSQMFYLELQSGARFLFIGDIAWHLDAVRRQTSRPWLVSLFLREDTEEVFRQINSLKQLLDAGEVNLVPAHDSDELARLQHAGLIKDGFRLQP